MPDKGIGWSRHRYDRSPTAPSRPAWEARLCLIRTGSSHTPAAQWSRPICSLADNKTDGSRFGSETMAAVELSLFRETAWFFGEFRPSQAAIIGLADCV
jgi:hypothetical protein